MCPRYPFSSPVGSVMFRNRHRISMAIYGGQGLVMGQLKCSHFRSGQRDKRRGPKNHCIGVPGERIPTIPQRVYIGKIEILKIFNLQTLNQVLNVCKHITCLQSKLHNRISLKSKHQSPLIRRIILTAQIVFPSPPNLTGLTVPDIQ
ncbi:hypothetical protein NPIL_231361 [Nephila pilipes]|uniref:Uncharacterized protein n=1 Tax=Nephila pilipes TaxID=299642 RepID=A0A8X6TC99_NEPPI|nr:hypothetical protein NPIL_231361 [Nephila pilipes]